MKRIIARACVILAVIGGAFTLWQMREALQLFGLALLLATGLDPSIRWLTKRGMRRNWAIGLTFASVLGAVLLGSILFGSLAYTDLVTGIEGIPAWYDATRTQLAAYAGWRGALGAALPPTASLVEALAGGQFAALSSFVFGLTSSAVTWAVLFLSVVSLGFYWLLSQQHFERLWFSLLPLHVRVPVREVWKTIYTEVGIYVQGVAVIVALSIVALTSVFSMLDVPGAVVLAVVGGLAQVIPLLGIPIALLPAVFVALAVRSPLMALSTLVLSLVVLGIIKGIIAPRLFRRGVNVNPVLVILLIMALAELGGLVFIVLAPPLAAAIQSSLRILTSERATLQQGQEQQYVLLQQQLDELATLRVPSDQTPQLQALITRAQKVIARATTLSHAAAAQQPTQEPLLERSAESR